MPIEIIRPLDRDAWLRARNKDVTASQVGALFGEHEFTTLYQLWALKTGRLPYQDEETPAMRRGRLLEPVAVQILREDYPKWKIDYNAAENIYYRDPDLRLGATPDVIAIDPHRGKGVVQIKSVEASIFRRKWTDEEGRVEPPFWIALQATLEAHMTGSTWAAIAPLVVGHSVELPLVEVPLDYMSAVIATMAERSADFWKMIAEGREPAADYTRDAATIEAIYGEGDPEHEVDLTADNRIPDLIAARRVLARDVSDAREQIEAIDAEVKGKLGFAHVGHIAGGAKITWKPARREGFFVEPTTIRALRYPQQKD